MGIQEDVVKAAKPIVAIILGIFAGYIAYNYSMDIVLSVAFALFTGGIAYVLSTGQKMGSDIVNALRFIVGLLFGLVIAYGVYSYTSQDLTSGIIAGIISVPVCIYLLSKMDRAGGGD